MVVTLHLRIVHGFQNKQQPLLYTPFTDWFSNRSGGCSLRGTL